MSGLHIFREYDIRGIFGTDLSEEVVGGIGYHFGVEVLGSCGKDDPALVTVGMDARTHSPMLREWVCAGLMAAGVDVGDLGMIPTPVSYFSQFYGERRPAGTIMITGSHNPPEYNGFKMNLGGAPYFGRQIQSLGRRVQDARGGPPAVARQGRRGSLDALAGYIDYHVERFRGLKAMNEASTVPVKIAVDSGNGVAALAAVPVLRALGFDVHELYSEPDGTFPNHHPDPAVAANLNDLQAVLAGERFDLGVAYDGDGDRIGPITPSGRVLVGDELLVLFAEELQHGGIRHPVVIGEVKCSQTMYDTLARMGARPHMFETGHSKIKTRMKEVGAHLAGEVSGHIFFAEGYYGYDDAIHATIRLLERIARLKAEDSGYTLDRDLARLPASFATPEIKVAVPEGDKFGIVERFKTALSAPPPGFPPVLDRTEIDGVRFRFEQGWGLVRPSNTTPVLVLRFEASSPEKLSDYERMTRTLLQGVLTEKDSAERDDPGEKRRTF